jgi:outer membrane protein assembly factor BamB
VTESHILWRAEDNVPDTCSPLATASQVFALTSGGILTCYDAKKGDKLWEEDLGNIQFKASLSLVGNRLYLLSDKGKCLFVEPGKDACKKVGEADLGEPCVASPAFQDGRIYIRGEKNLYCIGK